MTGTVVFLVICTGTFFTATVLLAYFASHLGDQVEQLQQQLAGAQKKPAGEGLVDLKKKCKAEIDSRNARIEALAAELETERASHRAVYVRAHLQGLAIEQCRGALAEIRPPDEPVSHDWEEK